MMGCMEGLAGTDALLRGKKMINIVNDQLEIRFTDFGPESYATFLRAKSLPEYQVRFNEDDESYTVTAPARFASMLGIDDSRLDRAVLPFAEHLYDDQLAIEKMALDAKRFACWSDCGLGKTLIGLEFARHVAHRTGKRVLIFTLNEIVPQWIEEANQFYGEQFPVHRIESRSELKFWASGRWAGGKLEGPQVAITNYEKMNPDADGQVVNELRSLGGVILDESDRLKGGGGKQKWALIHSCKGIEYKLSLTATPAPNDTIEFASQASFLEKMRTDSDIIWTYFHRDKKTQEWTVKRHAREAFFRFMASWSIYVRDPRKFGWRMDHPDIPEPEVILHELKMTSEQRKELQKASMSDSGQKNMFSKKSVNTIDRGKMSQVAKGFRYLKGESAGKYRRIASLKPAAIADLVTEEMNAGLQGIIWTVFDAEAELLKEAMAGLSGVATLTGKTKKSERPSIIERFRRGEIPWLIARASMLGYGMNFQHCRSMIFSGWNDSYVAYYQAIRRAYRHGQKYSVRVHLPVIPDLEGDMLENVFAKESRNLADIEAMEASYVNILKRVPA